MKKNYIKCLIYTGLIIGWNGCSSEMDQLSGSDQQEVVFHIEQADSPLTKATAAGFEIGDSIGIYAVRRSDASVNVLPTQTGNQAHNSKWIKTPDGWQPASLADKIVYPQDGSKLDFYAYYPYNRSSRNPENILMAVKGDQENIEAHKASDFMTARNTTGINEGTVTLTFSHVMASVEVEVKAGAVVSPEAGLGVQIAELATATYLNLGTNELTPQTEMGTVVLARQEEEGDLSAFTYRGYVPAQNIAAGTSLLRCVLNGKIYIYSSEALRLLPGNRTHFELVLKTESE